MPADFVHVHVHSEYSFLDSIIRLDDLVRTAEEMHMPAVAITDHASISGVIKLYKRAKEAGIKPLIGCEVNVKERYPLLHPAEKAKHFHLVLLAINAEGYRNLLQLTTLAQREDVTHKPFIDNKLLVKHREGLLALSGDAEGQIPWLLFHNSVESARTVAMTYQEIFGDRFYLELQQNGVSEWEKVEVGLLQLGRDLGIKVVASNDCHYIDKQDYSAHQVFLCIQTGRTINDPERFSFSNNEFYFKSPEIMARQFERCPEALTNTMEVAERCNLELNFDRRITPIFPALPNETLQSMLEKSSREGLGNRIDAMFPGGVLWEGEKHYWDRLEEELAVIRQMDVAVYFLIVADYVNWARNQQILVGPGRGASAGSLVAYALHIVDVNPIRHGLFFERFLNLKRTNIPDFDIDVCHSRRDEVINYLAGKYGRDNVAQVITFKRFGPAGVLRSVGKALALPENKISRVVGLIPEYPPTTLRGAVSVDPRFKEAMAADDAINSLVTVSQKLEGVAFGYAVNAAAFVIAPDHLINHVPVFFESESELLTQFDRKDSEETGLIVFDLLRLKALTVIDSTLEKVKQETGTIIDLASIQFDDRETLALLSRGENSDIFPLNGKSVGEVLVMMRPCRFSDLSALIALYRPAPMEAFMLDEYIWNKRKQNLPDYPLEILGDVLDSTWGVLLYQEQVMQIAQMVSNYSAEDADIFWRRLAKKNIDLIEEERRKFISGAMARNISFDAALEIFAMLHKYSDLCFPKAFCVAYATIAYQVSYLKAHYPVQFAWACKTLNEQD